MTKNNILFSLIIAFCTGISSCNTSKNSIQIKLNDIDSAIRVVIPSHNCGCNWQDRKSNIYISPVFKKYGYVWQSISIKNIDSVDVNKDSKKVYEQLKKLDNKFANLKRFFLEYRVQDKLDSTKFNVVGTWYHFENYCDGYITGITATTLERNTAQIKDRIKLCK